MVFHPCTQPRVAREEPVHLSHLLRDSVGTVSGCPAPTVCQELARLLRLGRGEGQPLLAGPIPRLTPPSLPLLPGTAQPACPTAQTAEAALDATHPPCCVLFSVPSGNPAAFFPTGLDWGPKLPWIGSCSRVGQVRANRGTAHPCQPRGLPALDVREVEMGVQACAPLSPPSRPTEGGCISSCRLYTRSWQLWARVRKACCVPTSPSPTGPSHQPPSIGSSSASVVTPIHWPSS